jgi:hypothetical protein
MFPKSFYQFWGLGQDSNNSFFMKLKGKKVIANLCFFFLDAMNGAWRSVRSESDDVDVIFKD